MIRCIRCNKEMAAIVGCWTSVMGLPVLDPSPEKPSMCLDCSEHTGLSPESESGVDLLIRRRGVARRLLDGGEYIFDPNDDIGDHDD